MQILNTQHDYRQFIGDTLLSKLKGGTYQEGSLRKMGDIEARESVIKFGGQIGENQTLDIEDLLFGRSTRLRILNGEYQYSSIVYTNNNHKFLPSLNPNELGERKTIDTPLVGQPGTDGEGHLQGGTSSLWATGPRASLPPFCPIH